MADFRRRAARGLPVAVAAAVGLAGLGALADDAAPPVRLDKLLRLPDSVEFEMERRGGATRTEWRARFKAAKDDVVLAKKELDQATDKLEKAAVGSDQWRFVPPGGDVAAENNDNLRLRMDVTKKRETLAHAEKRARDLEVEANLASVPPEWRE